MDLEIPGEVYLLRDAVRRFVSIASHFVAHGFEHCFQLALRHGEVAIGDRCAVIPGKCRSRRPSRR